jgi:3-methyl-2-oxobutanoate hydroxymethyltransferase
MNMWNALTIRRAKGQQKLACLTAYDFTTARLIDEAGIPLILVGDSLAMTMLGHATTLPATMDDMVHHSKCVTRAVQHALVVGDMPFMSYQVSEDLAVVNAGRFVKEAGTGAVKIEGGVQRAGLVERMVDNGIAVMGHIGLTPQSVLQVGGYHVEGRTSEDAKRLLADAEALQQAGVFALVLECMPAELGAKITQSVDIPTIGIGAGPGCDGQILVVHDMLGLQTELSPKFVKRYTSLSDSMSEAFNAYKRDVEIGNFPTDEHSY